MSTRMSTRMRETAMAPLLRRLRPWVFPLLLLALLEWAART